MHGWGPLKINSGGTSGGALAAVDLLMQQPLPGTLPALGIMRSAGDGRPHRPSFDSSGSSHEASLGHNALAGPSPGPALGGALPANAGDHALLLSGPARSFSGGGPGCGDGVLPGLRSASTPGSGNGRSTDQRVFVADGARNASTQSTNSVFEPFSASQPDGILKGSAGGGGREGAVPSALGSGGAGPAGGGRVPSVLDEARGLLAFGGYQQPYSSGPAARPLQRQVQFLPLPSSQEC